MSNFWGLALFATALGVILVANAKAAMLAGYAMLVPYLPLIGTIALISAKLMALYLILEDIWVFFEYGPEASETYFADLMSWLGVTGGELQGMHEAFKVFKTTLGEFAEKIKLAFQNETFRSIVKWIFIIIAGIFLWKVALIGGVVYAIMFLVSRWDFLVDVFKRGFVALLSFLFKAVKLAGKILIIALFPISALYFFKDEIKSVFEAIGNFLLKMPFVQSFVNQFYQVKDKIASIFSGMWQSLKSTFQSLLPTEAINAVIDSMNWISTKLNEFSSGKIAATIGLSAFNLPSIPRIEARAEGGPVSAGKIYRINERRARPQKLDKFLKDFSE